MSKKNLDKLFQEKFNNFQESPEPKVWRGIEASLNEKDKKRRIIPLWWKVGGVAAIIALGLFVFNPFSNSNNINSSVITDIENKENNAIENTTITNSPKKNSTLVESTSEKSTSEKESEAISVSKKSNPTTTTNSYSNQNSSIVTSSANFPKINAKQDHITSNKANTNIPLVKNASNTTLTQLDAEKENATNTEMASVKILEKENTKNSIDSNAIAEVEKSAIPEEENNKKSIYDEIKAQKALEEEIAETKSNKWSAGANVAPVYFNGIGEGSPVGAMFVSNTKSGETNLSYGLSVGYELSKKLSIRSGLHKVDYAYNTNNVSFSSNFNGQSTNQLSNIDYDANSINLELFSTDAGAIQSFSSTKEDVATDVSSKNPTIAGVMSQQLDYVEIPLELKYQLVDSKFGVDIIGGVSSLFLLDNSVFLSSGDLTTTLGEANNINNVNFSTNIGVGLNYKFTPKVRLNVEPMFKYQLNTFSNTQGSFAPYSIGIYSGLSFKF